MGVSGKARGQGRSMTLLTALVFLVTASWDIEATMDADRIAATSRRIREEFRQAVITFYLLLCQVQQRVSDPDSLGTQIGLSCINMPCLYI